MSKRKLATIQEIKDIEPIKNADKIEVASVLGWKVVVRKDEFKPGDKAVYFEIDSFLPDCPEYEFLGQLIVNPITKISHPESGYRLHTMRLRGQLSQGLLISFDKLAVNEDLTKQGQIDFLNKLPVGTDVTRFLNVTKYDSPETSGTLGNVKSQFPTQFVDPTDELRVQGNPPAYNRLLNKPYYISSKIDGTSTTIIKHGDKITFATNNSIISNDESNLLDQFITATGIKQRLLDIKKDIVLQGEFYGEKIQSNRLGIIGNRLCTFNMVMDGKRLGLLRLIKFAGQLGLELPTIVEVGSDNPNDITEIKKAIKQANAGRKRIDTTKTPRNGKHPGPNMIELLTTVPHNFNMSIDETVSRMDKTLYRTNHRPQEGGVFRLLTDNDNHNLMTFNL